MKNPTEVVISDALTNRYSPYAIDPKRTIAKEDLLAMFEAARWTMSCFNAQPWRYIIGVKENNDNVWQEIFECLVEANQPWAQNAPVLVLGLAQKTFEYNGADNSAYLHDLGAASASLTFEASSRGLVVHQMLGLDQQKAHQHFHVDDNIEVFTAMAVGYPGSPEVIPQAYAERDEQPRQRKALSEIIIGGSI